MSDNEFVTITTTYNDPHWMRTFARDIIGDRLAACVNILPVGESVYAWEGAVETAREGVALIHTTRTRAPELVERLKVDHPYDEPQILEAPVAAPTVGYARWLQTSTLRNT